MIYFDFCQVLYYNYINDKIFKVKNTLEQVGDNMSKLENNYNWNGEYVLLKKLKEHRFKISNLDYPEYFYIFINDDNTLRYTIIDDKFGMPSLANTMDAPHAVNLRKNSIYILDNLVYEGFIEKIGCEHFNIIVAHYACHIEGEIGDRIACEIRCKDCGKILFKSEGNGIELAYDFIEKNKIRIKTLFDMTCDSLNERFNIPE